MRRAPASGGRSGIKRICAGCKEPSANCQQIKPGAPVWLCDPCMVRVRERARHVQNVERARRDGRSEVRSLMQTNGKPESRRLSEEAYGKQARRARQVFGP